MSGEIFQELDVQEMVEEMASRAIQICNDTSYWSFGGGAEEDRKYDLAHAFKEILNRHKLFTPDAEDERK